MNEFVLGPWNAAIIAIVLMVFVVVFKIKMNSLSLTTGWTIKLAI